MDFKTIFVFVLFVAVAMACSGRRGGRRPPRRCRPICTNKCSTIRNCARRGCPRERSCRRVCRNSCGINVKRSLDEHFALPVPSEFKHYDNDEDGEITLNEFADALNFKQNDVQSSFEMADSNSDERITCDEFKAAIRSVFNEPTSC